MSVTGRTYTSTRPRGLAPWKPQAKTQVLLDKVLDVLTEYAAYLPLTARQVFYRLVGSRGYEKTERAYERLCEMLNRARRAGFIEWEALRDDGVTAEYAGGWGSIRAFWTWVERSAETFELALDIDQDVAVEVWVEAAGMVPQAVSVAHDYGVPVFSSGGFDSVTAKFNAAERFIDYGKPVTVLHVGDYDPSGCSIVDSAAEDIEWFCQDLGSFETVEFRRVAVTPEQIGHYGLSTAPQKYTDVRGERMAVTVQAEALAPDQLAAEIRAAVEDVLDLDAMAETRRRSCEGREEILARIAEFNV